MSENTAVYDLGEIRGAGRASAAPRRAATVARPSVVPALAGSAALFVPGSGHLIARDFQAALFFGSGLGFLAAVGWALWRTLDALLPILALLEVAPWTVGVAFVALYVLAGVLHVFNALDAYSARLHACLPRRAPALLAAPASALLPGWGQLLAGKRVRAGFFLSALWLIGGAWLVALPEVRGMLAGVGVPVPVPELLIDRYAPPVLLSAMGAVWAVGVWDALLTRPDRD